MQGIIASAELRDAEQAEPAQREAGGGIGDPAVIGIANSSM